MQFEDFDNKIREAADHHHPAYDENAWGRMEKLLDKHLPREKDNRRRIIFFLLLFLFLGGAGTWLFISKPWTRNKQVTAANTTIQKPVNDLTKPGPVNSINVNDNNNKLNKDEIAGSNISGNENSITKPSSPDQVTASLNPAYKKDRQKNTFVTSAVINKKIKTDQPVLNFTANQVVAGKRIKEDRTPVEAATTNTTAATIIPVQQNNKKDKDAVADKDINTVTTNTKPVVSDLSAKENTNNEKPSLVQNSPEKKAKDKNKKKNSFFFTLSAGPDISATGGDHLGKAKLLTGAGLGYTFKDRLTIRSGFYSGRKIYTSSPGSYHPPTAFWTYYPNLQKVEADCRVYEIPLSLSYNFSRSSKHQVFASTGLSSLLMKRETYNYYYKYTATGPTETRKYSILDQNKHYFSILTLSGGYQKNIGRSLSVTVEPYLKLPLSGIGFGNVKLNSGGVLFSVGIKPFAGSGKNSNTHR